MFDLYATLDDKTREMLHIYQPLIAQDTGLPATATMLASTDNTHDTPIDERSKSHLPDDNTGKRYTEDLTEERRATNVLLVDDNEVNLKVCFQPSGTNAQPAGNTDRAFKVLGACVKRLGYSHTFAADGQAAIDAFEARETGPFNLIFMDLSMPVLDGFEATKGIRAIEDRMGWTPATIVVLSAFGTEESKEKAMKCDCDIFLTKPASPKKIRETVKLLNL